ncbi:MAG: AMP-binding protein [Lachnospiraceae bacterium]|nr:AMP-binding protein [Lachnospiraceae bacterium]
MAKKNYPLYETTVFRDFRVMVENVAEKYPDRPAVRFKKNPRKPEITEITFTQMKNDVRDLGTASVALGCRGAQVSIIGESSYEWIITYFSLMASGAVTVPIDKELPAPDMQSIIVSSESSVVFYSKVAEEKIMQMELPAVRAYVCMTPDAEPDIENAYRINDLIADGGKRYEEGDRSYYEYEIDPDRLASIVFTSGTTGKGKGVMLSTTNIVTDMTQGMYNFAITDNTLGVLPPHHTFCSTVLFVGHLSQGACIYISAGLKYIMNELKEVRPTHLVLVPLFVETFYKRIWANAEKQGKADALRKLIKVSNGMRKVGIDMRKKLFASVLAAFGGKLEFIICGGAALNQDIIDTFDGIGVTILNGYGITECAPLISCNRNKLQKPGSVGTPIIGEEIKILDPDEKGEGEICVKGTNVMLGYFNNPEATAEAFTEDGFFRTGDYGKLDEDGWVYITGRKKNLIIFSNGKNVYPEEIETEISRVPGVNEVVVYAGESKSDPSKEVIVAEIYPDFDYLREHGVPEEEVNSYFEKNVKEINTRMVSYKTVGKVKIRHEEFVKNTSKKIVRFKIDKTIE